MSDWISTRTWLIAALALLASLSATAACAQQTPNCGPVSTCPSATTPLSGTEMTLGVQNGRTVQINVSSIAALAIIPPNSGLPHVTNNTALTALTGLVYNAVVRDNFNAPGDSPPLTFTLSSSPCSLNAGAGDLGSQVPQAAGGCWIAQFPSAPLDTRWWGVDTVHYANFTGVISGTTLTVSSVTGAIAIGMCLADTPIPHNLAANTCITGGSGTTWTVNHSQTVSSEAMYAGVDSSVAYQSAENYAHSLGARIINAPGITTACSQILIPAEPANGGILGVGRPVQFATLTDQHGSTINFGCLPANTDGFYAPGILQQFVMEDFQVIGATKNCANIDTVYGTFSRMTFARCGNDGLYMPAPSLAATYLTKFDTVLMNNNGANGLEIGTSAPAACCTTLDIRNTYAIGNGNDGFKGNYLTSVDADTSAGDQNGAYGWELINSNTVHMNADDNESNQLSGVLLNDSSAVFTATRVAINNQSMAQFTASISGTTLTVTAGTNPAVGDYLFDAATPSNIISGTHVVSGSAGTYVISPTQTVSSEAMGSGVQANYVKAINGSQAFISYPDDYQFGLLSPSIISLSGSVINYLNNSFSGFLIADSTSQINGVQPTLSAITGSIGGGALGNNVCTSGTVTITGAHFGDAVNVVGYSADPGGGWNMRGFVNAPNTVTVVLCNNTGSTATPAAATYNVHLWGPP